MGDRNLITGKPLSPDVLSALRDNKTRQTTPLSLTPYDAPYFFSRIDESRALRDQQFPGGPFITKSLPVWHNIHVDGTPASQSLREELEFLEKIGLAMARPATATATGAIDYAVMPNAIYELYRADDPRAPGDGIFINVNTNREIKARKFVKLLLTYVLPGMFWRNYYVTNGLSSDLHLTSKLGADMLEIGELWDRLAAKFGWPLED